MKKNKMLILLIFVMSLFILPNKTHADFNGVVTNASPRCTLHPQATGKCVYANSSANSLDGHINWLDVGDEVYVYEDDKFQSPDTSICSDYYVKIAYTFPSSKVFYGYYCHADIKNKSVSALTDELKTEFQNEGFPESYWEKLAVLKQAHPNWIFKAAKTELNFSEAVDNEAVGDRSLVQLSSSNNYALLSYNTDSFDYLNNKYYEFDNVGSMNPWLKANKETIAYYMDPRNFLIDMYIFQFESLSYDSTISDDTLKSAISAALNNDYLQRYTDTFLEAGKQSQVNPIYLASLARQEVGGLSTPTTAIDGTYNGMFNFYNIGATGGTNPVIRGLEFASYEDASTLRPWNTPEKGIIGGAIWIAQKYISAGQSTSYFKRFNVIYNYLINNNITSNPYQNYWHQYMTNVMAPTSEAYITFGSYTNNNSINDSYVFLIPVYENMPESTSLPTKEGWPNNYIKSISINGTPIPEFKSDSNQTYKYYLDVNTPNIEIKATPISNLATISGDGKFTIDKNKTISITCKAQNGNTKTYNIEIILTGEINPDAIDIKTTLNKTDIKNNDTYLSGIAIGTDVSVIKQKIVNVKSDALVTIYNSKNEVKSTGAIATGDKVNIILGAENKTFDVVIYGDVSGDGKVKANDYGIIVDYVVKGTEINGIYKTAADVNRDSKIKANDYGIIVDYVVKNINIKQ